MCSFMNQTSFAPVGLKYWGKNYDSLVSSGWKCISEIWCEEIESLLFTNSASLTCLPCSGLHLQETTDHCLHCEELLQLSVFSILLSQAALDKQCLYLFRNLFTKYGLCQKLIDRIYASSIYISHLAGKVFVSLISLNPFQYFTENGFEEMVLLFIHHHQSHMDACRGFLILKNILRTKLPNDVNTAYVSALNDSWTTIISAYKEHITELKCNLAFLSFWWKLFKNINKNRNNVEFAFYKSQMTNYFFLHLDYLCQKFQSSATDNEHLYKINLKLFCAVLNYETDMSVEKNIPVIYHNICAQLLQNETFSQAAFSASVLRSNHPVRIGGSNIQSHPKLNTDQKWIEFQSDCICPSLNMSLLRKLILLEFNVCAIAIRSEYFKNTSESKDTNVNVLEKIILKLQQICLFIHDNLQAKSQLVREQIIDWLPQVFADQDNSWVQVLLALTDLYVISKMWNEENRTAKRISTLINAHLMFQQFLESLSFDSSVLLDLLTSPETCFLLYFLKYLKLLSKEWHLFKALYKETDIKLNKTTSTFCNMDESNLTSTKLPNRSTNRTMKMIPIPNKKFVIVDSEEIEVTNCRIHNSQNVSLNHSCGNEPYTTKQSENISFGIGTKQDFVTKTHSVSNWPIIDCHCEKSSSCLPYEDSIQMLPVQSADPKYCFADSEDDKDVSCLSQIEKKQADDKMMKKKKICKNTQVKGIGLACIQLYSNNSSSSDDEEDENFINTIKENHVTHNLSFISKDVLDTEQSKKDLKYTESETIVDHKKTLYTSKRPEQQFKNTVISSTSNIPKVASSTSKLDHAMSCLNRLLQLLKRLSKSSVFPYNSQPLINALESCLAHYET